MQPLHSPAEAANLITDPRTEQPVNAHTLRRWCALHAEYLSDGANPGKNVQRRLTARDVEVLRTVAQLRAAGLGTDEINAQLTGKSFAVVVDDDEGDDVKLDQGSVKVESPDVQPPQSRQDAPLALVAAQSVLQTRIEAIERRLDDQAAATRDAQRDRMIVFAWGVGVGLVGAVLLLLAAYLLVTAATP